MAAEKEASSSEEGTKSSISIAEIQVFLNVYDLKPVNDYMYWVGFGIFHSGIQGNITSVSVVLPSALTFYSIWKEKSTGEIHCLPCILNISSAVLWFYYAFHPVNLPLLVSNSVRFVIAAVSISIFIKYATRAAWMIHLLWNFGVLLLVVLITQFIVKKEATRVELLGWFCAAYSIAVSAAPLGVVIIQVIRTKRVNFMTLVLSLFVTINAVMWFAYGLLHKDLYIAIPNVLGILLGITQLGLYMAYRKTEGAVIAAVPADLEASEAKA